ncbi:C4-dicarboxylate ABC transporter, partial [Salmonella enterica subsp. enterica serovar Typhi]|nr:C4-dicarboxylate ABC transporter [Salmonella enterica subsp. enterica serovar Typhi]
FAMMTLFMTGVTSLVESSAVGALLSVAAAWWAGNLNRKVIEDSTRNTLTISCMFMWIILGALCFSSVYDGLGAVKAVKALLVDTYDFSPWTILILMLFSFIIMGMFLDDTAMLVIVAPLYIPLVKALGFDPIWFGILYTITCQIAYITPPFGYNLFLMRAMAPPEITLMDIYRSIIPFFFLMVLTIILLMIFPQIALWLPSLYRGG